MLHRNSDEALVIHRTDRKSIQFLKLVQSSPLSCTVMMLRFCGSLSSISSRGRLKCQTSLSRLPIPVQGWAHSRSANGETTPSARAAAANYRTPPTLRCKALKARDARRDHPRKGFASPLRALDTASPSAQLRHSSQLHGESLVRGIRCK